MTNKKYKIIFIIIVIFVSSIIIFNGYEYFLNNTIKWASYSNKYYSDYNIEYPSYMNVQELGMDNRRSIISTKDFKISESSGKIESGFKLDIAVGSLDSLDSLFNCNEDKSRYSGCILAFGTQTGIGDYTKGEVRQQAIKINTYSGVKYEFISNNGENNNIGLVVKKNDAYYEVIIAYRDYKNIELFNKILSSFSLK